MGRSRGLGGTSRAEFSISPLRQRTQNLIRLLDQRLNPVVWQQQSRATIRKKGNGDSGVATGTRTSEERLDDVRAFSLGRQERNLFGELEPEVLECLLTFSLTEREEFTRACTQYT